MWNIVEAVGFSLVAIMVAYAVLRDLRTGASGDSMYHYNATENPLGYPLMIATKILGVIFFVMIGLKFGERVRFTLINDTMMTHPIHLHGMWSELENEDGEFLVRKHTVVVQPAQRVSYRVSADAMGRWAYHCHLLYHMEAGMFREVVVA